MHIDKSHHVTNQSEHHIIWPKQTYRSEMLSKHVWSRSTLFFQFSKYGKAIAIWFIKMCLFIEQVSVHQPERRVDLQRAGSQDDPYHTIYVHINTYCTLYTCTIHQDYMWTNAAHMLSTRRHAQNILPTFWTTWCSEYGIVWNYTVITKKGSWLSIPCLPTFTIQINHLWIYHTRILWVFEN